MQRKESLVRSCYEAADITTNYALLVMDFQDVLAWRGQPPFSTYRSFVEPKPSERSNSPAHTSFIHSKMQIAETSNRRNVDQVMSFCHSNLTSLALTSQAST